MPEIKRFVFNDETIPNTYGFYILTAGIDLTRFKKNPVMLSDHWNSNSHVLGKWNDFQTEGTLLTGLPEFDSEDENAAKIQGKVERGYLSGCSMGIIVDRENLTYIDGKIFLTKCELAEVSIVPVPSNANAVRLMNSDGKVLEEEEIKNLCLSVSKGDENELKINTDHNMKKIILSVAALMALGYKNQPNEGIDASEVDAKIVELSAELAEVKKVNENLKLAAKTAQEAQVAETLKTATTSVELAITQGKIPADKKESFIQLGVSNPEVLKTTLDSIPAKMDLAGKVITPSGNGSVEVKTMEEFQKLSTAEQLAFKNDNPNEYNKLVETIK